MKFVFLVDLFIYNNRGETLLEDSYIRLPNGPVPDIGFSFTDNSNAHFTVKTEPCDPERIIYQYTPVQKSDMSAFSAKEIRLFNTVLHSLQSHKTEEISELTHRFSLWKDAANGDIIPVKNLKLDEYEYDELESFIYYADAVADAKKFDRTSGADSGNPGTGSRTILSHSSSTRCAVNTKMPFPDLREGDVFFLDLTGHTGISANTM